ncbi:MAG: hypothetical protein RQ741_12260 [Wenzhouxiangellaceae bacterium]|nr:hypothetical protein [Wenzhouxiangellaceae bacterium]
MNKSMGLTGESSSHKIAGVFDAEQEAREALSRLVRATSLADDQVVLVKPDDPDRGRKLEPESRGIWHTLIRAHLWLGLAGAIFGGILFWLLAGWGVAWVGDNPAWAAGMLILGFFVAGLLLGGLLTLRPDHVPYLRHSATTLDEGKFLVAVHARSLAQLAEARQELKKIDARTIPAR